jgi:hypothetical protein
MSASTWRVLTGPAFDTEAEASCGTSVAEAREALGFWRARHARLPWYRRAARAEALEMAARWQARLVHAELERWRVPFLTRTALAVLSWWGPYRGRPVRRAAKVTVLATRVSVTARVIALAAAAVAVAAIAMTALVAVLLVQVL